ncbi:MAG: bifunctional phosphoribosylaminoimidazolecarboxamide formyltransferase/IMP cyclohydrolase [Bacteroidetes bacterium]|nr:bifunctional phosphoribosylaminoimidazolecarboxamide formyltransferase/IMP cyclohydrolase [Bacteroidota bacterium]
MSTANITAFHTEPVKLKRALLSVSDKTGIVELAQALHHKHVELISTGGTYKTIHDAGIPVTEVSEVTGFPECLDGRVKTLHPVIHAGILARMSHQQDAEKLQELQIEPIELVVVNLYPFRETIAQADTTFEKAVEFIDIGGPTMVRAAAKNFSHVSILTSPEQYAKFIQEFTTSGEITFETRRNLARDAFQHTADYDAHIATYLTTMTGEQPARQINISLKLAETPRYGENPHQGAAVYGNQHDFIDCFHGKQLSYNNYLDTDAALQLIQEFPEHTPACVIVKHTNPCGVATGRSLKQAWDRAFQTDTVSPFGGIIAVNTTLDIEAAAAMDDIFSEIIIAPDFTQEAIHLLTKKVNRRLIKLLKHTMNERSSDMRSIFGGILQQDSDHGTIDIGDWKVVTSRQPTEQEKIDMEFAWKIVKHVKSNAIVFAKDGQTLGIGNGQTSRVDSSELAVRKASKANLSLQGSAVASDAFFPFADGIEAAARAGASAIIQPGGSVRDQEVIDTANDLGLTMIFTGMRHFRH